MFDEPYFRFYILLEHLITFEYIQREYGLEIKTEIDTLVNNKTQVYYIRRRDFPQLDELCKKYQIDIIQDNTPHFREHLYLQNLPSWIQIPVYIMIIIFIIFLIF